MSASSLFLITLFISGFIVFIIKLYNKNEDEDDFEIEKSEIDIKKEENLNKFYELKQTFGQTTKIINYNFCKFILISDSRNLIMINNNIYDFKDILTFEIKDNSTTIFTSTSKTSTSTSSMLGRAIVGGILLGEAGTIIGGSTASKSTQTEGRSSTIHDYSIIITLNNLSTPIINLYIGKNGKIVSEIITLLNIIQYKNSSDLEQKTISDVECSKFKKFYEYLPEYISEEIEQKFNIALSIFKNSTKTNNQSDLSILLTKEGMPIEEVAEFISWNK